MRSHRLYSAVEGRSLQDYIHKRSQYAAIGVPEYWLLDPVTQTVTVLSLAGDSYREIGVFGEPAAIASVEFAGLELTVEQIFAAEDKQEQPSTL